MNQESYLHSSRSSKQQVDGQLTLKKLILLVLLGGILCHVLPLFAAVPLVLVFMYYGIARGLVGVFSLMAIQLVALNLFQPLNFLASGVGALILATVAALALFGIVVRQADPGKGVMVLSLILLVLGILAMFSTLAVEGQNLRDLVHSYVVQQVDMFKELLGQGKGNVDENWQMVEEMVKNPQIITDQVLRYGISAIFCTIYFNLWISLYIVLRNSVVWRSIRPYSFTLKNFLRTKHSVILIYALILSAGTYLLGAEVVGEYGEVIAVNALIGLGAVFFFQGLGVMLEIFNILRFGPFVRILIMLILVTSFEAVALVAIGGLLDNWFDFAKLVEKKSKNEGDIL